MTKNSHFTKWILLRGLARNQVHWGDFLKTLTKNFPDSEFLAVDTAGNGDQSERSAFLDIESSVNDLRSRTKNFRQGKSVGLLTISLGGMLGLSWADRFPEEVAAVACINTSDARLSPFFHRMRPLAFLHLLKTILRNLPATEREAEILKITTSSFGKNPRLFQDLLESYAKSPSTKFSQALRQLISAAQFKLPVRAPKAPVLLLSGLGDQMVNPDCTNAIAKDWQVPAHFHEWAGHDLPIDDPQWICDQLRAWLKGV